MSESVHRSLRTEKKSLKFITKLSKIPYSFFLSSTYVKIVRFAIHGIRLIKVIKDSKRKNQKKITLFS